MIWLVGVFVVEKLIYGIVWVNWLLKNDLSSVYEKDTMAGMFFSMYGLNDWIFCFFFLVVFIKLIKLSNK